jgi:hypothetical protein
MRALLFLAILASCQWSVAQSYVPGVAYFGNNNYVEYVAGNLPIILSAPHGGLLSPAALPDRDCSGCSTVNDFNTQELARAVASALYARTGCWPHLVVNRLHRRKLDANRDLPEAADGNAIAGQAWAEFHDFLGEAKHQVALQFGKGLYVDIHGHAHAIQRLELGYLLYAEELQLTDSLLNLPQYLQYSSIQHLARHNAQALSHAALLRGQQSLGAMLQQHGYAATPSDSDPYPMDGEAYFSGGYNTARYSSYSGGAIDGVQIECNRAGIRDSLSQVTRFADSLAVSLLDYLAAHYFQDMAQPLCAYALDDPENSAWQIDIAPLPYCRSFNITQYDATGNWIAEVFDFYGNYLFVKDLPVEIPVKVALAQPKDVIVVLRRNGEIMAAKTVLHYCR